MGGYPAPGQRLLVGETGTGVLGCFLAYSELVVGVEEPAMVVRVFEVVNCGHFCR